jgi:hypothetical protein
MYCTGVRCRGAWTRASFASIIIDHPLRSRALSLGQSTAVTDGTLRSLFLATFTPATIPRGGDDYAWQGGRPLARQLAARDFTGSWTEARTQACGAAMWEGSQRAMQCTISDSKSYRKV